MWDLQRSGANVHGTVMWMFVGLAAPSQITLGFLVLLFAVAEISEIILCSDVDECREAVPVCHEHAHCDNLPGSYRCICKDGYYGDGTHCQGIFQLVYTQLIIRHCRLLARNLGFNIPTPPNRVHQKGTV